MKILFTGTLNQSLPQTSSTMQTMIHGIRPFHISAVVTLTVDIGLVVGIVSAESSRVRSLGDSQSCLGCQTLRNRISAAIEQSEAPMSTIHGLTKFEIRNCGIANETPVTRMAGQISFMPFQPAKAQITQKGTISEKKGSCRPTIAPSRNGSMPVAAANPRIGVPSAP